MNVLEGMLDKKMVFYLHVVHAVFYVIHRLASCEMIPFF